MCATVGFGLRIWPDHISRDYDPRRRDCADASPTYRPRRGVPQGRHPHALLMRGAQTLGELFPGIFDALIGDGAPVWDDGEYSRLYVSFGGT